MTMSVWPTSNLPDIIAIIPRIWTHYRTRPNTSAPNQGQAPFWFHTNVRMLIGENQYGWQLLLLAQNEGQFLHLSQTPSVTKPATENAYMTRFYVLCRAPPPPSYPTPRPSKFLSPRAKRKKNGWSLPLVLFNYCFVVQDVQEMSPASVI